MSQPNSPSHRHLIDLTRELREENRALALRVDRLTDRLAELELRLNHQSSAGSYEFVNPSAPSAAGYQTPTRDFSRASSVLGETPPFTPSAVNQTWEEREELARGVGRFLRRSLEGDCRGGSGRDRIRSSSRLYIIVRDVEGRVFDPIRVVGTYTEVKSLCQRSGSFRDSIFVGLPSRRELFECAAAGGFTLPSQLP